jgi:hypothetical protein
LVGQTSCYVQRTMSLAFASGAFGPVKERLLRL